MAKKIEAVAAVEEIAPSPQKPRMSFDDLVAMGIPLQMVVFHKTVRSYHSDKSGVPEYAFYASGGVPSRTAELWYTPHGIAMKQRHGKKIIPLADVCDTLVK